MKHPYNLFDIECGVGWKSLYQPLIDYIEDYNSNHSDSHLEIYQIKEKFAGLRFYWGGENIPKEIENEFSQMVHDAEDKSHHICEQCGSTDNVGVVVSGGWYYTACEDCAKRMAKENNRV